LQQRQDRRTDDIVRSNIGMICSSVSDQQTIWNSCRQIINDMTAGSSPNLSRARKILVNAALAA